MVLSIGRTVKLGQLERTARAFQKDAWEAMRGDIVRALVEYITNADDSYARVRGKGRILVEVEHRREPWKARVRDRASGMSMAELRGKIGTQGGRTSGFADGADVRGNLGLGSKDPACFGQVTFESIKDGEYACFAIDAQGDRTSIERPAKVTKEMRDELGVPGNGTVVTLDVIERVLCPRHDNLKGLLSNHVLLRDIMQDEDRHIFLLHASKPGARSERLRYQPAKVTTRVSRKNVELPGYLGAKAEIFIGEADEPFADEGRRSPTRGSGILIKGRRAIYESTLFGFEGNQYAMAFTGWVKSEDIDRIADEYDERAEKGIRHPVDNSMPIISRRREGLVEEHPLYKAILRLVEGELGPLVAAREKRAKELSRAVENAKTTKLFSQLAREAAKFMQEIAEEEELDLPQATGDEPAPPLAIVPGAVEIPFNTQRTLTVMAAKDGLDGSPEVKLEFAPTDVVQISARAVNLRPSPRRDDVLTATVKVTAGASVGVTLLTANLGLRTADCAIEVTKPMALPEPIPPTRVEFERSHYRLVLNKPRSLKVRAPLGSYAEATILRVASSHRSVVVLDGGELTLRSHPAALAMEGTIRVEGRVEKERAVLTASDPSLLTARAEAEVVRREESGTDFKPELVPEVQGDQRAQWSSDYRVLRIMGEHPAVKPHLGDKDDGYPGQDSPQFRLLMAELVTDAVVRRIVLEKYGDNEIDVGTFYVEQYRLLAKFLSRARVVAAALE